MYVEMGHDLSREFLQLVFLGGENIDTSKRLRQLLFHLTHQRSLFEYGPVQNRDLFLSSLRNLELRFERLTFGRLFLQLFFESRLTVVR